jgi:uncharacterized sodium:solute symporter family permease YidK
MLIIGQLKPKTTNEIAISDTRVPAPVDMTPWVHAKNTSLAIMVITVSIYLALTIAAN